MDALFTMDDHTTTPDFVSAFAGAPLVCHPITGTCPRTISETLATHTARAFRLGPLTAPTTGDADITALRELRNSILPAWIEGNEQTLYLQHGAALATALAVSESAALAAMGPADRTVQRAALTRAEPAFLADITAARKWVKKNLIFTTVTGGTISVM